jgi:hypothetical protein
MDPNNEGGNMAHTFPDTWAWDDYDQLITDEWEIQAIRRAKRHAEIIQRQVESFDAEALPWTNETTELVGLNE